ncbi:MAG: hydrogenase maturation nickel metallochaperone HypA [Coriobacteriia bacterium]
MHEMGITEGILAAAAEVAQREGASRITEIHVTVGDLTDIVPDSLQFAFEVLREDTLAADAVLIVERLGARSKCGECGEEFEHGRFEATCPACGNFLCELVQGRELRVDSIDIDTD